MASETERTILDQHILRSIAEGPPKLTGFLARKGAMYTGKLMVVGRAGNGGWDNGIALSDLAAPSKCEHYSRKVLEESDNDGACPMQWVADDWENPPKYNPRKSAFWRVIRDVVRQLDIVEKDVFSCSWSSHLVWSNLYKVSPEGGGNPDDKLCEVQLKGCKTLLEHEIKTYKPVRLLFLTGWDWAEAFLDFLPEGDIQPFDDKRFVKASGSLALVPDTRTRVVVAVHPQGKKENKWVEKVVEEFKKSRDVY